MFDIMSDSSNLRQYNTRSFDMMLVLEVYSLTVEQLEQNFDIVILQFDIRKKV